MTLDRLEKISESINGITYAEWCDLKDKIDLMFSCQILLKKFDNRCLINHYVDSPYLPEEDNKKLAERRDKP